MWGFIRALLPEAAGPRPAPTHDSYIVARTDLTRRARRALVERERQATTTALRTAVTTGRIAPLPPRDEVVAQITARRATSKGA